MGVSENYHDQRQLKSAELAIPALLDTQIAAMGEEVS